MGWGEGDSGPRRIDRRRQGVPFCLVDSLPAVNETTEKHPSSQRRPPAPGDSWGSGSYPVGLRPPGADELGRLGMGEKDGEDKQRDQLSMQLTVLLHYVVIHRPLFEYCMLPFTAVRLMHAVIAALRQAGVRCPAPPLAAAPHVPLSITQHTSTLGK